MRSWSMPAPILCLAFSPDGHRLAIGSGDPVVRLRSIPGGDLIADLKIPSRRAQSIYPRALCWSPQGDSLAVSKGNGCLLWKMGSLRIHKQTSKATHPVFSNSLQQMRSLAFSTDGQWLAFGGEGIVGLCQADTLELVRKDVGQGSSGFALAFSPDGKTLVASDGDFSVALWDVNIFAKKAVFSGPPSVITGAAFSPDNTMVAYGGGTLLVARDVVTMTPLFQISAHTGRITSLAYTPDGRHLVSAALDGSIGIWDARTGRERGRFNWEIGQISTVAVAPDGLTAVAGGQDGQVVFWDFDESY